MLDASAALAAIGKEPGADKVIEVLPGALMSTVNISEVLLVLRRRGMEEVQALRALTRLGVTVRDFTLREARIAAQLHTAAARRLSLGDRACLAVARIEGVPAVTADRNWRGLDLRVEVEFIR